MITCTTQLRVKPEHTAAFEALLGRLVDDVVAHEPGTHQFELVRSRSADGTYLVLEQYVDKAALDAHSATAYLATTVPEMLTYLSEPPTLDTFDPVGVAQDAATTTVETYFHVGVIVADLEKAMAEYSRILGLTFAEPTRVHIPFLSDPEEHPHDVHVTFSEDGPPYYELIEAHGDGIFSAAQENRILYVGMYEPDMLGRMATLREQGIDIDAAARFDRDAAPDWIITAPGPLGIRVEYVDAADRPHLDRWVHTGVF